MKQKAALKPKSEKKLTLKEARAHSKKLIIKWASYSKNLNSSGVQ